MGNICSTCKKKVKGKEDKYKQPEQPADINDHITIATSQGGTLEKDKEGATCSKSKPSSTGSSDTTKTENKKPDSKKPKKQKYKADPDSSDSSDTSSDSSDSDSNGYKKHTKKVYNKHGGTTIINKQVKVGGTYTKIKGVNNMVVNINNGSQPEPNIPKQSEVKTRYEPYNDKTKEAFTGRSRVGAAHGNFVYIHEGSHSRIEGIDVAELKVRSEKSICRIRYPQMNGIGHGSGFRIGPPDMNLVLTANHVLENIKNYNGSSIVNQQNDQQQGNNLDRGDVWCVFNHNTDDYQIEEKDKFYFNTNIYFNDPETDTAILELKPKYGIPMPPSLTRFCMPEPTTPFYLIGHPSGGKKKSCLSENIINMEEPTTSNHINIVRRYCTDERLICEPSRDHRLDNPARWLFHVTDKFTKGASGCPGLVFNPPHGVSVVTVLLRGYPDFYYDENATLQQKAKLPPGHRVEQGANMHCVFANLRKKDPSLYNQIIC